MNVFSVSKLLVEEIQASDTLESLKICPLCAYSLILFLIIGDLCFIVFYYLNSIMR